MSDTSLPTEVLEMIIEDFIYKYTEPMPKDPVNVKFIPRWYLTPLLRVSKRWYAVCAKHLYKCIALGSNPPFEIHGIEGRTPEEMHSPLLLHNTPDQLRRRHEVARDLCRTLSTNSRLAAFVERLQLGIESVSDQKPEWSQPSINVLRLCPSLKHVEICGFEPSALDALVDVLQTKSLISFSICTQWLSEHKQRSGGNISQIFAMMTRWPNLQSIWAEDFLMPDYGREDNQISSDISQVSRCCPELREIILTGAYMRASDYRTLRAMCGGRVTKLALSVTRPFLSTGSSETLDVLCECLHEWSPTLEYFKISAWDIGDTYPPLNTAISTLCKIRELQVGKMKLDFGIISNLPRLNRYSCFSRLGREAFQSLSRLLEDLENFPSLNDIVLREEYGRDIPEELHNICRRRNIHLEKYWAGGSLTTEFLL